MQAPRARIRLLICACANEVLPHGISLNMCAFVQNRMFQQALRRVPSGRGRLKKASTVVAVGLGMVFAASAQEKVTYQDHVLPLIENNCGKCHNPDKKKA